MDNGQVLRAIEYDKKEKHDIRNSYAYEKDIDDKLLRSADRESQ